MNLAHPHFANPQWLWLAVLGPVALVLLQVYASRAHRRQLAQLAAESQLAELTRSHRAHRRIFRNALLVFAISGIGFACDFPRTREGKNQRSGYPDLRLEDKKTGRTVYLDPKLYEAESRSSTFRTFYFEPKTDTGKIHDDAVHLIVGFEHTGKAGAWKFTHWELVDLSKFRVRLKAEFQGSNRDLYREEAIVGTSRK